MRKFYLILLSAIAFPGMALAQTDTSAASKATLDSMLQNDPFFRMLDSLNGPASYFDISLNVGNGVFSTQNNNLNAEQAESKQLYFTPSVAYQHKSGLGIAFSTFFAAKGGKLNVYQYVINPSYVYTGRTIQAGLSYSRLIPSQEDTYTASPFTNDLYASFKLKNPWLKPGIYIGFATGKYKEYLDTLIRLNPNTNPPVFRRVRDTMTNKLRDFSLSASVEHSFSFDGILGNTDNITITPVLLLTSGFQKITTTHSNNLDRFPRVKTFFSKRYGNGSSNSSFSLQSVNLSTDLVYSTGRFYAQPLIFLDYYLPATTEKKLTAVFSFTVGVSF